MEPLFVWARPLRCFFALSMPGRARPGPKTNRGLTHTGPHSLPPSPSLTHSLTPTSALSRRFVSGRLLLVSWSRDLQHLRRRCLPPAVGGGARPPRHCLLPFFLSSFLLPLSSRRQHSAPALPSPHSRSARAPTANPLSRRPRAFPRSLAPPPRVPAAPPPAVRSHLAGSASNPRLAAD